MNKIREKNRKSFLFSKGNYIILLISIFLLCLGFIFMIGGGGQNDFDFNPAIFSFQRIVLAPIIILLGYVGMVFAIFYND
ncbi:MAG: hypothetical protein CMP49_05250 [Flavobacteriales bacterium]|nr:hypothetical protein [Flavobacteriales bacterium]|tara:strand:+ start:2521 stop:2760 length:240 start_codon:yes stop_codon:yes gene_type:complete